MSAYLSASSSSSNRKTWTWSGWTKKSRADGSYNALFTAGNQNFILRFGDATNDRIVIYDFNGSTTVYYYATDAIFRDVSGWYHVVLAYDTTQSTSSDRLKVWVNGTLQTALSGSTYPSLNYDGYVNNSLTHYIAHDNAFAGRDFLGVMAHVHFTDGTAYAASDFGETDSTTGIWKPKTAPSVTYGTNGFFLKFENSGSMGTDSSGNANNFTVNGTLTQTVDTPSNVFCTMNPLNAYYSGSSFSNGNLTFTTGTSQYSSDLATLGVSSGKYYWEVEFDTGGGYAHIGIKSSDDTNTSTLLGYNANDYAYRAFNGQSMTGNTSTAYGDTYAAGDIIGVALDLDNNFIYWSKNGTWQNSGDPTSGATGTGAVSITDPSSTNFGVYIPAISFNDGSATGTFKCNFGNGYFGTSPVSSATTDESGLGTFEYTVPTGYYALCTKNINEQEYS